METTDAKKSFFETPMLSTKIKSANVKLVPEAAFGYLVGPAFALIANSVVNTYLSQYWRNVLGLGEWAYTFTWLLPLVSAIIIVIGNLLVGRLFERKPSIAGKARPFILIGMPLMAIALLILFLVPFPKGATAQDPNWLTLVFIALGYNLYFAVAYPFYYTSHSALVNLSTRDRSKRSLLATASNAAQIVASGAAGMVAPFFIDALGLLPAGAETGQLADEAARSAANSKWVILMAILIGVQVIGCLLEYYFTRERITEEKLKLKIANSSDNVALETKKVPMSQQIKICTRDKFWWMIIIFYFLYQLGGMLKNNDATWFSQAFLGANQTKLAGTINTVGAIPTALGMLVIWPLARKFGKANCIKVGGFLAFIMGCLGFLVLPLADNTSAVWGISITAFCLKSIGTVPAMYISMALLSDVLEHQEAIYGVRTDGFSMAVYGSIMIAMPGIANAIINLINNNPAISSNVETWRIANTFIYFGGESICYLLIGLIFLFMGVERFSKLDKQAITSDQKELAIRKGAEWVDPEVRLEQEQAEAEEQVHQEEIENLRRHVEKNNAKYHQLKDAGKPTKLVELVFEDELQKYETDRANKKAEAERKKTEAERKKTEAEQKKPKEEPKMNTAFDDETEREFLKLREAAAEERNSNLA